MLNSVIFIRGVWTHVAMCAFLRRAPRGRAPHDARPAARSAVRHHEHLAPHLGQGKHGYAIGPLGPVENVLARI